MENLYDNGALMLGNIDRVIEEVKKEIKEDVDMCFVDKKELLKDLQELKEVKDIEIVMVNYENSMGYTIDYWTYRDRYLK